MNIFEEAIARNLENNPVRKIGPDQVAKLALYTQFMLSENEKYNLTAIKDPEKAALLHIVDSLTISSYVANGTLCDVGAGAGFPSLPLSICRDDLQVTALDATEKKVRFMNSAAELVQIASFQAINGRAEELFATGMPLRESFDTVTARAVAPLNILCELCLPAAKVGGRFIAMRGETSEEEMKAFENKKEDMLRLFGAAVEMYSSITLCGNDEEYKRYICIFQKKYPTNPKYPRSYANMKKKPIF